ncbi:MAG: hypothetical protein RL329_1382 [Bacteroidota bacterium]|jgi:hypothetical protein
MLYMMHNEEMQAVYKCHTEEVFNSFLVPDKN